MITEVLSVGGSIIAPDKVDTKFISDFSRMICSYLARNEGVRLIFVAGGGAVAREYQKAYREIALSFEGEQRAISAYKSGEDENFASDMIGIMATRLNAQLLKTVFGSLCEQEVVVNPSAQREFTGRVLVAAGWKPGFSTDNDAVLLAETFGSDTVINLSNIKKVYTDDPKRNKDAKPIDNISWKDFRKIVGDEWVPGKNCPFDPVASRRAEALKLKVICAYGKDIQNLEAILDGKDYEGTTIF